MAYTKGTGNWKDKWGAATEKGAQRTQQDQAWYQSHKEIADQARKQLANNGGMSGTQFGRKPSVPQYIGSTSEGGGTSGTSGTSGKDSYSGRPTTTYDPTAQLNAFYAQQQAAAEEAARRQAEILQQQYERQKAAEAEAGRNRRLRPLRDTIHFWTRPRAATTARWHCGRKATTRPRET